MKFEQMPAEELVTDPETARELIHALYKKGERPVVSVPKQYAGALAKGLQAHASWIPGFEAIVGTFGEKPYVPGSEERVLVKVDIPEEQIEPRFTGPERAYHGIVVLKGPIPAEHIAQI